MKKILIYRHKKSKLIERVEIKIPANITEEELQQLVHNFNNDQNATRNVEVIDINDNLYEAFQFLIGEDGYVIQSTIRGLWKRLDEIKNDLESMSDDISSTLYKVENNLDYLKEKLDNEKDNVQ